MAGVQPELWRKFRDAPLTHRDQPLDRQIARESALSELQAEAVLFEYRRFLYLAVLAPEPAAPSPLIGHVWRLHHRDPNAWDAYARAVGNRLPRPPKTPDAAAQTERYAETLALYRLAFRSPAPSRIWPSPAWLRYGRAMVLPFSLGALLCPLFIVAGAWPAGIASGVLSAAAFLWYRARGPWDYVKNDVDAGGLSG